MFSAVKRFNQFLHDLHALDGLKIGNRVERVEADRKRGREIKYLSHKGRKVRNGRETARPATRTRRGASLPISSLVSPTLSAVFALF